MITTRCLVCASIPATLVASVGFAGAPWDWLRGWCTSSECIARRQRHAVPVPAVNCADCRDYFTALPETIDCSQCNIGGQSAQASSARDRG